jgi:hypothetical protein
VSGEEMCGLEHTACACVVGNRQGRLKKERKRILKIKIIEINENLQREENNKTERKKDKSGRRKKQKKQKEKYTLRNKAVGIEE